MNVGKNIQRLRLSAEKTQQQVARQSGIAESYLSRLENGRISPSIPTLDRLARALEVPITAFFGEDPKPHGHQCPIALSGRCIGAQLAPRRGRRGRQETYTPEHLELLKACNYLLLRADRKTNQAFRTMIGIFYQRVDGEDDAGVEDEGVKAE